MAMFITLCMIGVTIIATALISYLIIQVYTKSADEVTGISHS